MKRFILWAVLTAALIQGLSAQVKPNPYDALPPAAPFQVTSFEIQDGAPFPAAHMSGLFGVRGGKDLSPALSWSQVPPGTKSFAVTVFDPDAPTPSGFWHWFVVDLPASATSLPVGAGSADGRLLPRGARQIRNDAGLPQYLGPAPPAGRGAHRYYVVVHALDVEKLDLAPSDTPALVSFKMLTHTLGRAIMVPTAEQK